MNKKIIIIASLLCLVGCNNNSISSSQTTSEEIKEEIDKSLKIMSCNLDQGATEDKHELVANKIKEEMPDLFGVQEETHAWEEYLRPEFEKYGYEHVLMYRGGSFDEASGIFYSVDRFSLIESGAFWLGPSLEAGPGYVATEWGAQYPRVCTFVILKDKLTNKEISYYNSHFDYTKDVPVRKNSAEQIINKMKEKNVIGFLSGDLNFYKENEEDTYKVLTDYFDDSYLKNTEPSCTFHDYGKELDENTKVGPNSPIDSIFSTKGEFETKEFKILKETGPTFYSDHFFIEAVFDYKN